MMSRPCRLRPSAASAPRLCSRWTPGPKAIALWACLIDGYWMLSPLSARAEGSLYFNPHALDARGGGVAADLDAFSRGEQLPGEYWVDIYLNHKRVGSRNVTFVVEDNTLRPQLTVQELNDMGIHTQAFASLTTLDAQAIVTHPGKYIPEATTQFDFAKQRLDIGVPQASLRFDARNAVDPSRWNPGLSAFVLNYNLTGARHRQDAHGVTDNAFLNLGTGINLGAWRLRNNSTYTYTQHKGRPGFQASEERLEDTLGQGSHRRWQSINTYAQRDIQRLGARLSLGEGSTSGTIFEAIQFRGAQLTSDDSMLPDSQRGFAPVVRGVADGSAQITVHQNGYMIYQTYVAPGPYVIRDLYATAGSGDLQVTVREDNGKTRTYTQPYSSVPLMQREARLRYEFTGGRYRSPYAGANEPSFGQASAAYGLSSATTVYGGVTGSADYASGLAGLGKSLGSLGSVSFDATQATARLQDKRTHRGQSYRVQYAKDLFQSGTTFTLAGYRYSTSGFYDFNEANEIAPGATDLGRWGYHKRSRVQVQLSQLLGEYGSLHVNAFQQDYWRMRGTERNASASYNVSLKNGVTLGLTATRSLIPGGHGSDRQYALGVQIPLSTIGSSWLTSSTQTGSRHGTSQSVAVNGQALENNNLNYAVRQSYGDKGKGHGGGTHATYKGTNSEVQAAYSYTGSSQQYSAGLRGGLIAHRYGVTLSQPLGHTVTLVRAPGAAGVRVQNQPGIETDRRGYAVVPYATTYRENRVALWPETLDENVDLADTVKTEVPTQGAVVLAEFETRIGSRALVTLRTGNEFVPFGATATLFAEQDGMDNGQAIGSGIVGARGELYLSGVPRKARVQVKWGTEAKQSCSAGLSLVDAPSAAWVKTLSAVCAN
jgi:outer membrane usher protein